MDTMAIPIMRAWEIVLKCRTVMLTLKVVIAFQGAIVMSKVRRDAKTPRRVWRITAAAPHGEYVEFDVARPVATQQDESPLGGWAESSHDLANGLDVYEGTVLEPLVPIDATQSKSKP